MNYVTWTDFALLVVVAAAVMVSVYLINLVRNINESAKILKDILRTNRENVDETLKNAPAVVKNAVEITDKLRNNLNVLEETLRNMHETAEMTAAAASTVKNDILTRLKGILELVELIRRVFFTEKSKAPEAKKKDERKSEGQ